MRVVRSFARQVAERFCPNSEVGTIAPLCMGSVALLLQPVEKQLSSISYEVGLGP
jgi:hypothetical protein